MKRICAAVLAACWALGGVAWAEPVEEVEIPVFRRVTVHDPSVIRTPEGDYYIYGSHMAAARSEDLISWEVFSRDAGAGCTLVEDVQQEMADALSYARTSTFWAPDVQQLADGRYYLYYCTCEGSSPLSAMGLAVSDEPEGPFEDLGVFLRSGMEGYDATQYPNVVDPHVFFDHEGRLWMVYGSYSGGIFALQMDPQTGLPLEGQGYGTKLLGGNHSRIEAPYVLYNADTGYYYLFLSFGGLDASGGYNIRVCRSRNPDGPYEDALGQDMRMCMGAPGTFFHDADYAGYGVKLLGGYCFEPLPGDASQARTAYRSPGHNSAVYEEETDRYFIVFHTRFARGGEAYAVMVHQMYFNEEGWPVVSPLRYAGEMPEPVEPQAQTGLYKVVFHGRDINAQEHGSVQLTLHPDGSVTGDAQGTWACESGSRFSAVLDGRAYSGVMHTALDTAQKQWVTCFTALDAEGAALWGIRAVNE